MENMKKPFYKQLWFIAVIIVVIAGVIGGAKVINKNKDTKDANETASNSTSSVNNTESTETSDTTSSADSEKITDESSENKEVSTEKPTYEKFMSVKMGMSYDDVVKILGEGVEVASEELDGVKTTIYQWKCEETVNMDVTIEDGVVTSKDQIGLQSKDAQITLEKYDQIKEGITYDEMVGILGEGVLASELQIGDSTSEVYQYVNADGSEADFLFNGSELSSKSQIDLK